MFLSKVLILLALTDSQALQETAHAKSYKADTSTKYTEYLFHFDNGSFLFDQMLFRKILRGSQS